MRQQGAGHDLWVAVLETAQRGSHHEGGVGVALPSSRKAQPRLPEGFFPPGMTVQEPMAPRPRERAAAPVVTSGGVEVQEFLESVGLWQYADCLLQGGFDEMETLLCIEDSDMSDLGIPRGHQVKLKKKMREHVPREHFEEPHQHQQDQHLPPAPQASLEPKQLTFESKQQPLAPAPERVRTAPQPMSPRCMVPTSKMASSVEQSWELVKAFGVENIGQLLFRDLFEVAPRTQDLFSPEVRKRYREWMLEEPEDLLESPSLRAIGGKIMNAIGLCVAGLQDVHSLVPRLQELGGRHFSYGLCDAHLHILGKCLVRVLRNCLGEAFTAEVEFAWTMVYNFISAIMVGGLQVALNDFNAEQDDTSMPPTPGRRASWQDTQSMAQHMEAKEILGEGCYIEGGLEVYLIGRHLQKAIFGDVFEATGMTSDRSFAVKSLDLDLVRRFERLQQQDHQFCESPLSEVKFAKTMSGLEHVVQMEDEFSDQHRHYIVSELAKGGDLLEALRLRPGGFPEHQAQILVRGATIGLATLHLRGLAMQDVSVENMLLYELEDGEWQVKVCDPGQAVTFSVDPLTGTELDVDFRGFVGKEFRPPELYSKLPYAATKVDAWCLGWSAFYLLTAQPMFQSADPSAADEDWELFEGKAFPTLFNKKGWRRDVSPRAKDFILKLMDPNPDNRMSILDALRHPWLAGGSNAEPVGKKLASRVAGTAGSMASSGPSFGFNSTRAASATTSSSLCSSSGSAPARPLGLMTVLRKTGDKTRPSQSLQPHREQQEQQPAQRKFVAALAAHCTPPWAPQAPRGAHDESPGAAIDGLGVAS